MDGKPDPFGSWPRFLDLPEEKESLYMVYLKEG
jgi:hypothetical protein